MVNTILLVDDNTILIEIQKEFLEVTTVDVLEAYDGLMALDVISAKRPDLIFMDLHMPKMDGAQCCRAIKSDPALASIPVVMITSNVEDMNLCFAAKCDHFLSKPLDSDKFLHTARHFIQDLDRRERRVLVDITSSLRMNGEAFPCRLLDLSVGGAFVVTDYFGIPDSVIQITFALPDGTEIQCHGRIAWVNRIYSKFPRGLGIKFALMPKEARACLSRFLQSVI